MGDITIPFTDLAAGDRVRFAWDNVHANDVQELEGAVAEVGEFEGKYAVDDGTPFVLVDVDGEDRDFRLSEMWGGNIESVTYDTVASGNAQSIGDLVEFEVVDDDG